jgi:hypothetical protein
MEPAPELRGLRGRERRYEGIEIAAGTTLVVDDEAGASIEVIAELPPGEAAAVGVVVRRTPDGMAETAIVYDWARGTPTVDCARSSQEVGVAGLRPERRCRSTPVSRWLRGSLSTGR